MDPSRVTAHIYDRYARAPPISASLPQASWLSDVSETMVSAPSSSRLGLSSKPSGSLLRSGSMSDTGSNNARALTPLHFPSTAGSSHSGSSVYSRASPQPPYMLHTSRSFTSGGRLPSSASQDRDAGGHLDLKRLLSKPAKQSSASSIISLTSDSEPSGSSPRTLAAPVNGSFHPRQSPRHSPSLPSRRLPSTQEQPYDSRRYQSGTRAFSESRMEPSSAHGEHERAQSAGAPISAQATKPTRNVLRRRPSARSNPNTPVVPSHLRSHTEEGPSVQQWGSPSNPPIHSDYRRTPSSAPPSRSTSNPPQGVRQSPSGRSAKPSKSPSVPHSAGVTPARAVALAYKQQEQRREELADTTSWDEFGQRNPPRGLKLSTASAGPSMSSPHVGSPLRDADGGGSYYTVFGSSSGRVVAVGSAEDVWNDGVYIAGHVEAPLNKAGGKSLSRKVSGTFKKVAESVRREREVKDMQRTRLDGTQAEEIRGAPHRREPSMASGKPRRPPLPRLSLDDVDSKPSLFESPVSKSAGNSTSTSAKNSSTTPDREDSRASSRLARSSGREGDDEPSPGASPAGGKWWKLMKRISTGGLREKYRSPDSPPPVPALPQSLTMKKPTSRTTLDISHPASATLGDTNENGVLLKRFMQSRSSLSGVRPSTAPSQGSSSKSRRSTGTGGRPSTSNTSKSRASISGPRPSNTTASSSPVSSEPASSGYFHNHKPASARSSFSSYGEEVPPVPKNNIAQYIVPPSELYRINKAESTATLSGRRSRKTSRSQSAAPEGRSLKVITQEPEGPSPTLLQPLPPPRRAATSPLLAVSTPLSVPPLSPLFNLDDPTNPFSPNAAPMPSAEFGIKTSPAPSPAPTPATTPPPRPKRSERRAPPPAVDIPPPTITNTSPRTPATPRAPPPQVRVDIQRRPSTGALSYASTMKRTPATSPSSAHARSPLTFRELESPRARLSEKEKADKWDDLLMRSARAGGTLHIKDASGLLSDDAPADPEGSVLGSDGEEDSDER